LLLAQQALLNAQIEQQRKSLEGNTVLQDTLQKQRDYVTANSNRLEHQLQLLQEAVNSKRLTLTEKPRRKRSRRMKRRVFRPTRWSNRSWILTIS
jgi:small-conductance mechanosensitive channel